MNNQNKGLSKITISNNSEWAERANYRIKNRKWLGYSGKVALRILAAIEDTPGMNQKKLAELAEVSQQQISKIVKGKENLTLQTIAKFSEILGLELISFPSFKYNHGISRINIIVAGNDYVKLNVGSYNNTQFVSYSNSLVLNGSTMQAVNSAFQHIQI